MNFNECFPAGFTLETGSVRMRPLQQDDAESFYPVTQSPELWKYFTKELDDKAQLQQWVEKAVTERADGIRVPFTIIDKSSGNICGSTSFLSISFYDKRIEIGHSWLGASYQGSGINRHCKYALMAYAFDTLQFERIEIKTDNLNERAKQAIRKIGGIEEGVLRSHMQMPHSRRRDSVYFSVLKHEWPAVKSLPVFNTIQVQHTG